MERKLTGQDGAVLGIRSCVDMHAKLRVEGSRLDDVWNEGDAFNFVVTAWHLYADWLPNDKLHRPRLASKKLARKRLPNEMGLVLDVLRDLANSSKHLVLRRDSAEKRVVVETHSGEIADDWAYFFQESIAGVTTVDDYYFSIRKLRDIVLAYFEWVFDDARDPMVFPGDLLWSIWICAPKNRDPLVKPPAGAMPRPIEDPEFVAMPARGFAGDGPHSA